MAKIKGKSMWSYTTAPDTKYDPCWRINVLVGPEEAKKAKAIGLRIIKTDPVMNEDEASLGDYKITFKRYTEKRGKHKGQANKAPIVVDADEAPFDFIIGNGSDVIVEFEPYTWNFNGKTGVSADLQKIKIINLVEYIPKDDESSDDAPVKTSDDF